MLKRAANLIFISSLLFSSLPVFSNESENKRKETHTDLTNIVSVQKISDLGVEVIQLKNGMKVVLKESDFDDEIAIRLTAMGGFSSLPCTQRASGELSASVALRSGLGNYTFDQLQAFLYQHSIDFNVVINPFSRVIEGSTIPEEVETLFTLINLCFAKHDFSLYSYRKIIGKEKIKIENRSKDISRCFEDVCLCFNSQCFPPLMPLTMNDLEKANFHIAEQFFNRCVADPSHFVCVIVGPFDPENIRPLVAKHLAAIPKNPQPPIETRHPLPLMSKERKTKIIDHFHRSTSMTKLTIPIQVAIDQRNIGPIESIVKLIGMRLRDTVENRLNESLEIQVKLEFPLGPSLQMSWLTIEYLCDPPLVKPVCEVILSELKCLQNRGVETEELVTLKQRLLLDGPLSSRDNDFWATILSNYFLRHWDPGNILNNHHRLLEKEQIKRHLDTLYSLDQYRIVSTQP
ncbi:MAG: insulinase family protein [Waddliaceae bacterium]